jgi:hypothetical protein
MELDVHGEVAIVDIECCPCFSFAKLSLLSNGVILAAQSGKAFAAKDSKLKQEGYYNVL